MKKAMQGAAVLTTFAGTGESMALGWMSNSVGLHYGQQFINPDSPGKFAKRIYDFTHADGYRYGSDSFNLDVSPSDSRDPRKDISHGDSEIYAVCRYQLYALWVLDQPLGTGLVEGYVFTLGFDASYNNNLAPAKKRALVFGPAFKFNGPGVPDLSLLYYCEKNHFSVPGTRHPDHTFDTIYMLNLTWMRPFGVGNCAAELQGFVNYVGEKGEDYNDKDIVAETLVRTVLIVAALPGDKRQSNLWPGAGYKYWHNRFSAGSGVGSRTSMSTLNMELIF